MHNYTNDLSINQSALNDSILDLFQNLRIHQSMTQNLTLTECRAKYEALLLKEFNDISHLSNELTLAYLGCLKPDSFIQEVANKVLDKVILSKLRRLTVKRLFSGDKIHLIYILLCFIEFYMVKPTTAEYSAYVFTKFEVDKIEQFIQKNSNEEALAKLHIKSLIGLVFSLDYHYLFAYRTKGIVNSNGIGNKKDNVNKDEPLLNIMITNIEKVVTCKDAFYSKYASRQMLKLFINAKGYMNTNRRLVRDYILHCITNKKQHNVLKSILALAGTVYYQTILILKWYQMLIVNKDETESYALTELCIDYEANPITITDTNANAKTLTNSHYTYFGNVTVDFNMAALIQLLLCDSFDGFEAINPMKPTLNVLFIQLGPLLTANGINLNKHLLYSYVLAIAFFDKFIIECECLSQIELNMEHYPNKDSNYFKTQLDSLKSILSQSTSTLIAKFFYMQPITTEQILNEINSITDPNVLLCMLILINSIYNRNAYFKQDISLIKWIIASILNQFFTEMIHHKYYNIYCLSYILSTTTTGSNSECALYDSMPDQPNFFTMSHMKINEYGLIYIHHIMYKLMYLMRTNAPIKEVIEVALKQYDSLMRSVFLKGFNYSKNKINYLSLSLNVMMTIMSIGSDIREDKGNFTLMYCMTCYHKISSDKGNRGMRLSKYLFQCAKCKQCNLMMAFNKDYADRQQLKEGKVMNEVVCPGIRAFIGKLCVTIDLLAGLKKRWLYMATALMMRFVITVERYCKDIGSKEVKEIKEKLMGIKNREVTMEDIMEVKGFYKRRKMLKWYNRCREVSLD